jgi:hypothetical protein
MSIMTATQRHLLKAAGAARASATASRQVNDSKGDVLLRPDGISFRLQSKRTDYPAELSELATVGIDVIALSTLPYIYFGACCRT